jgi:hypothetical protein
MMSHQILAEVEVEEGEMVAHGVVVGDVVTLIFVRMATWKMQIIGLIP